MNIQNKTKYSEALILSREVLKNFELSEISLENIVLKTARLARLLDEFDYEKVFQFEVSGYQSYPKGIPPDVFEVARLANRISKNDKGEESAYTRSIGQMIFEKKAHLESLRVSADPSISLSSANEFQRIPAPAGNRRERQHILDTLKILEQQLSERKAFIYSYIMRKNIELEFAGNLYDVFHSALESSKNRIVEIIPDGVQKLNSIMENLRSSNQEDWSNAVHSCRRLLESVADKTFSPKRKTIKKDGKEIKLGKQQYINRLIAFVESNQSSSTYSNIVGSQLKFLGDRLDAISNATQKSSHHILKKRSEAERYFIYTSLILSDILSFLKEDEC